MLKISQKCFDAVAQGAPERWLEDAAIRLSSRHPDWAQRVGPDEVRALCRRLDAFADKYRLRSDESFSRVADLAVALGRDPQPTAWQDRILSRPGFSEKLRLDEYLADVGQGSRTRLIEIDLDGPQPA